MLAPAAAPPSDSRADAERRRALGIRGWCLYDWANSAFATSVVSAILPPCTSRRSPRRSHAAPTTPPRSGATPAPRRSAVTAVLSPLLGALADQSRRRKPLLFALRRDRVRRRRWRWSRSSRPGSGRAAARVRRRVRRLRDRQRALRLAAARGRRDPTRCTASRRAASRAATSAAACCSRCTWRWILTPQRFGLAGRRGGDARLVRERGGVVAGVLAAAVPPRARARDASVARVPARELAARRSASSAARSATTRRAARPAPLPGRVLALLATASAPSSRWPPSTAPRSASAATRT